MSEYVLFKSRIVAWKQGPKRLLLDKLEKLTVISRLKPGSLFTPPN